MGDPVESNLGYFGEDKARRDYERLSARTTG